MTKKKENSAVNHTCTVCALYQHLEVEELCTFKDVALYRERKNIQNHFYSMVYK